MIKYDYLIVGAGLFGAVVADVLTNRFGKKVLVVEKRSDVGGTVATELIEGIHVHKYGAHIFRTSNTCVWEYVNKFDEFVSFVNSPIAIHNGVAYNLPFNMNMFSRLWGIYKPADAKAIIKKQVSDYGLERAPVNFEEFALSTVGKDIYECFIKEYTEKQWGKSCKDLPPNLMRRLPIRYTYDNNYYTDAKYQGVPKHGYSYIVERMLASPLATVLCGVDGRTFVRSNPNIADRIIYTGCIDEFFYNKFGKLEYRSLNFNTMVLNVDDFQGNAVVNYSDASVPYTRTVEHKHFLNTKSNITVVTEEYPQAYGSDCDPYYPIETKENHSLYEKYLSLVPSNMIFAGRLGSYKYVSMDDTIANAFSLIEKEMVDNERVS